MYTTSTNDTKDFSSINEIKARITCKKARGRNTGVDPKKATTMRLDQDLYGLVKAYGETNKLSAAEVYEIATILFIESQTKQR